MDEVELQVETTASSLGHRLGKAVVVLVATTVATVLAEKVYDSVVAARRNKTIEN